MQNEKVMRIGLLGASFDTGNLGVSALAESSIKIVLNRWPGAEVTLLDSGCTKGEHHLVLDGKSICVKKLPVRFCRNIFLGNHFLVLACYAFLFKIVHRKRIRQFFMRRSSSLACIMAMDMVVDITGGDSFSDLYGMRRFVLGFLRKCLVLLFKKDLIMLPQTYGPFKRYAAKAMARHILRRARLVYSRDRAGIEYIRGLLNVQNGTVKFSPDVAFILDSQEPKHLAIWPSEDTRQQGSVLVGLNVSALLFNGGYTGNNMFGLQSDYGELIYGIIETLLKDDEVVVLLIPHVFPTEQGDVESDPDSCHHVYEEMCGKYEGRIFLVSGKYSHNEIKHAIGLCDFMIGSRMHACIAALSQCIPAVGIAYSKKFQGVFESIGVSDCVIDARKVNKKTVIEGVKAHFCRRGEIRKHLEEVMPDIKSDILSILDGVHVGE